MEVPADLVSRVIVGIIRVIVWSMRVSNLLLSPPNPFIRGRDYYGERDSRVKGLGLGVYG